MFTFNAINDKRQGWHQPMTTVRPEGKVNGRDNTAAIEQQKL